MPAVCRPITVPIPSQDRPTVHTMYYPQTFTRDIQHKGWIGGWLMPQVGLATADPLLQLLAICAGVGYSTAPIHYSFDHDLCRCGLQYRSLDMLHRAQEKSYFALKLPGGWWMFGFDLGLVTVSPWPQDSPNARRLFDIAQLPEAAPTPQVNQAQFRHAVYYLGTCIANAKVLHRSSHYPRTSTCSSTATSPTSSSGAWPRTTR